MKIAIPTRNNYVDDHFGHCEYYTIANVTENEQIESFDTFKAPQGCGCKSDIATILSGMGVTIMLAGNMGAGAVNKVVESGIQVFRGCSGDVQEVTQAFLDQKIADSGETCNHTHSEEHQCNN